MKYEIPNIEYIRVYPEFIPEKFKLGFTTGEEPLPWLATGDLSP
jgi:hypothetical protein